MMTTDLFFEAWRVLAESAVFILVGFAIAGVLHVVLSRGAAARHLGEMGSRSVFLAALVGLPLPLCSCSVLPAAVTLRKKGASKGATLSFLISTPETSITSILLTYALLGPVMAVVRPLAAFFSAISAGLADNLIQKRWPESDESTAADATEDHAAHSHAGSDAAAQNDGNLRAGMRFAFVELFDDIIGWLLIGVLLAAVLNVLVPPEVLRNVFGGPWQSMLVMLVIGVPLYVCAEASTPIAAAFIVGGISPGAALVFLLVGPATNIGSLGVLRKQLGRRTLTVYLAAISIVALLSGWALNVVLAGRGISLTTRALEEPFVPAWIKAAGAVVFLMLTVVSLQRLRLLPKALAWLDARLPVPVTGRTAGVAFVIIALTVWLGSGAFIITPGETGYVRQFGKVVRRDLPPGIYYAMPWPVGTVDRLRPDWVHRLVLGYEAQSAPTAKPGRTRASEPRDNPRESWMLLADENVVNVKSVVQYGPAPGCGYDWLYGVTDSEVVVRHATLAAMRQYFGTGNIDTVLTTERSTAEQDVTRLIQSLLDQIDAGISCHRFAFLDLHAPESVHPAFRDVASAMEDRATRINQARSVVAREIPLARGRAAETLEKARAYRDRIVQEAVGRADRFVSRQSEYANAAELTRARLYFEMMDTVLPRLRKYIKPPLAAGGELEIWFTQPQSLNALPIPAIRDRERAAQRAR